jgi:hypothetical protein
MSYLQPESQSQSHRSGIPDHTGNKILCRCPVPSGLKPLDAAVHNDTPKLPEIFRLQDMWMFGMESPNLPLN